MITERSAMVTVPAGEKEYLFASIAMSHGGTEDKPFVIPLYPAVITGLSRGEIVNLVLDNLNRILDSREYEKTRESKSNHYITVQERP